MRVDHDETSGFVVTGCTYDDAGNITKQARVTDAGVETDTRTYNNLNQSTSSGGWTYQTTDQPDREEQRYRTPEVGVHLE